MTATTQPNTKTNETKIKDLVKAITAIKNREDIAILERLACRIELGEKLNQLKDLAGHSGWSKARDQAGFEERTAQRLMLLPGSIIDQIRTTDPDLAAKLPSDLQKLATLVKLSLDQLRAAFSAGGWDVDGMTRLELSDAVKAVTNDADDDEEEDDASDLTKHRPVSRHIGEQKPQGSADDQAQESDTEEEDDDKADEESEDTAADGNARKDHAGVASAATAPVELPYTKAVNETATAIHSQVIVAIRASVRSPAFMHFLARGIKSEDLSQAITRRVRELLAT